MPEIRPCAAVVRMLTAAALAIASVPLASIQFSLRAQSPSVRLELVSEIGSERATSGGGGKIVTFAGRSHVVWQDATSDGAYLNRVRSLDHRSNTWGPPFTLNQGRDNHARPVIAVDANGTLHVVLSGHNSPVSYRRSLRPNDATAWSPPEEIGSGTYPTLVAGPDGLLHVTLRNPHRWNGVDLYVKRSGAAWSKQQHLVRRDPQLPGYAAFHNGLAWGPEHRTLHAIQDFYESQEVMKLRGVHQAVCYLCSRDAGRTWQRADGTNIPLPARPEQMDVLARSRGKRHEPMPPPVVLSQGSIVVDTNDRPHVLYISHLERPGQAIHATTDEAGRWKQRPINELEVAFPNHRPIGCRGGWTQDARGSLVGLLELVPYAAGGGDRPSGWVDGQPSRRLRFDSAGKRLAWVVSHDNGASFTTSPALAAGTVFNQANVERRTGFNSLPAARLPPFLFFDGAARYRGENEVLQNNVYFARPQ